MKKHIHVFVTLHSGLSTFTIMESKNKTGWVYEKHIHAS